ncbi:MAG: S41 family peptidase [Ardenticatenaceae bacterium]|nr:S41 family peptidase [Ardenticatenaceae bacterium]
MPDFNDNNTKTLFTLIAAFCLLIIVAGASFYAGITYAGAFGPEIVEIEVTREVPVVVEGETIIADGGETEAEDESSSESEIQGNTFDSAESADDGDEAPAAEEPSEPRIAIENLSADDIELFFEVWDIIEEDFDGELPTEEELNFAIINASIETLNDDYTNFVEPDVASRMREDMNGSFEGIGAFVRENDEGLVEIVRPMDGRPADIAGLEAGDIIIEVDGENVVGQSLDEIITKVRGPRDTQVILGVQREGEEALVDITIIRARIEIPVVESELLDDNIGYIQLTSFNAVASERLIDATDDLIDQGATSLILDLRDNPGGFLDTAVEVADLYLPESVVLYERNNQGLNQTFRADDGDLGEDIPLVVLVNAGSASASELVAGALRDNDRAILIGEVTFGKGSVQQIRNLSNGSELRVTVARWFTPGDVNISAAGLTPDIEVELPEDVALGSEEDPQLQRAIEYLLTGE